MERVGISANQVSFDDLEWIAKLISALNEFRRVHPDITANQILALLHIFRESGISQTSLADNKRLDLPSGTVARICAVLSERGNRGTPGKNLIEIGHRPGDYRTTAQTLSSKGQEVIASVREIMKDGGDRIQ